MPELTREEKIKIFEKLPKELRDFMESENTGAFLLYLEEKYNLDDEKTSLLSKIVGDVVLGITPITSLAQEINLKIKTDSQTAMSLAQELYSDLLSPVITPEKVRMPTAPQPAPAPLAAPQMPAPIPPIQIPSSDKYREPVSGAPVLPLPGPEIVDLRKIPPSPLRSFREGGLPPGLPVTAAPIPPKPIVSPAPIAPKPLTFTKPVEPLVASKVELPVVSKVEPPKPMPSLIEADPHKISVPAPSPTLQPQKAMPQEKPQFIVRPPGFPPTDLPHDVLDLRKDKGEF